MFLDDLFSLKDKTAIVTGAGNGIGKATSLMLAKAGAAVMVSDLKLEAAKIVADEITGFGGKAFAMECNVTEDSHLVKLVNGTLKEFAKVNFLVNNAGGGGGGKENPFKITVDDFAWRFKLNVFSAWRLSQLCVPHMKETGEGSIVNISSMSSIMASHNMSAYGAAKAAMNQMTKYLAMDFGPEVRVNVVGPGAIKTDALATVLTPEMEKGMLKNTPMNRLGHPDDIAGAVLYFCSPASRWVSGQLLFVNGGGIQSLE